MKLTDGSSGSRNRNGNGNGGKRYKNQSLPKRDKTLTNCDNSI